MSFNDIYTAMQANMIDAFEVTLAAYTNAAQYEVAPYLILTGHQFTPTHITISEISYNRLPEVFRQLLREVSEEAARFGTRVANEADDSLVEMLVSERGATAVQVDTSGFRALVEPLYEQITSDVNGKELFEIMINMLD